MQPDLISSISHPMPWIGSAYLSQPLRVLVMGESHKMDGEPAPKNGPEFARYTIRAIEWRIRGPKHSAFFANVEWIMFDERERLDQKGDGDAEIVARCDFWHTVAFANIVPRIMDSQADKPDWRAEGEAARGRFTQMMDALQPDLICLFFESCL